MPHRIHGAYHLGKFVVSVFWLKDLQGQEGLHILWFSSQNNLRVIYLSPRNRFLFRFTLPSGSRTESENPKIGSGWIQG